MEKTVTEMIKKYNNDKDRYDFFDINCWWDHNEEKSFHMVDTFDTLKKELKDHYIKKAVITNGKTLRADPVRANEELVPLIIDDDNLYGCMVLVPEIENIDAYIGEKIDQGFVAARLFPKKMRHSMKDWLVGDILKALMKRRIPLILWHNEVSWDYIQALALAYANLPVIIEGNDVKLLYHTRNYIPLLSRHDNIYLETHNAVLYSEIEYISNEPGCADKLIYGSYYPYNTPDASMMNITHARISDEYKYDIGARNLDKLISGIVK